MIDHPIVTTAATDCQGPAHDGDTAGRALDDSRAARNRGGTNNARTLTGFVATLLLVGLGGAALLGAPTTVAAPPTGSADTITSTTDPSTSPTRATPTDEAPGATPTSLTRAPMTAQPTDTNRVLATTVAVSPTFTVSLAPSHPTGIFGQVPREIFTPAQTAPTVTTAPTAPPTVSTLPPTRTPAPPTSTTPAPRSP